MSDAVEHPAHYTEHPSGVECITITEHMNFCRGNAVKYIWRAGEKGSEIEDLRKARWYIDREITRLENVPVDADLAECEYGHNAPCFCADPVDQPESWEAWQDVPEGVPFTSSNYPDRPSYLRNGPVVSRTDTGRISEAGHRDLNFIAPFVRTEAGDGQ